MIDMFGLAFLAVLIIYLAMSVGIALFASKVEKKFWTFWYGMGFFLVVMLGLVFWDWLPMEVMYYYECKKNAGFTQYKTLDQWKQENPGIWETLGSENLPDKYLVEVNKGQKKSERRIYKLPDGTKLVAEYDIAGKYKFTDMIRHDGKQRYYLNQRFYWEGIETKLPFHILKEEDRIVDFDNDEILAKYVDYSSDNALIGVGANSFADYKIWMHKNHCEKDLKSQALYISFMDDIKKRSDR
jgi:hypothetical protein